METIRIHYTDFWPEWNDENFIQPILEKYFNVVIDQKKPDVLFHSIFGGMTETPKYKCKKILFLGENWRPSQFGSNYTISFDLSSETNFRLPLWQAFILKNPSYLDRLFNKVPHEGFERFCSFTVSNGGNFLRNSAFQQLNSYKRVHSYGRYMTNDMGLQKASQGRYWRDAKDEFFNEHPHKFALTYENTSYPWYCTEKIMDAFLEGSVPIYWGDPKVVEDWNPEAFINAQKLGSKWFDTIKKLDQNPSLFNAVYSTPVFTTPQWNKLINNLREFENWLINKIK